MRAASLAHRDRTRACCRHRALTHPSKPTFQGFNKAPCNSPGLDNPRLIRTSQLMALRTRRRLPLWAPTQCAQVVFLSALPRRLHTPSLLPLKHSNLRNRPRYLANTGIPLSRIRICNNRACNPETSHKATTPTSLQVLLPLDHPRRRTPWANP